MKLKLFFTALVVGLVLFGFTESTYAQKKGSYSHAISANPVGLAFGMFNALYEHQFGNINTFTVSGLYYNYGGGWSAFGLGGSVRWYPDLFKDNKNPIEGFSFGPAIYIGFWK